MENSVQVPKFDGKNFASWKFRIVSILEGKELDDLLECDPPEDEVKFKEWKKKDAQAKGIITCAMTDSLVALILNCKTSKDIWIALHERYEGDKKKKIIEARNDVSRLTMKKEENWEEYLYRSEKLLEQARNLGAEIEDQEFTTSVIRGLPQKYNLVALQLNSQMKVSISDLKNCLKLYHERFTHEEKEGNSKAFNTMHKESFSNSKHFHKNRNGNKPICFICAKPGHKAIECWHNPKNNRASENKQTSKNKPEHQNKAKFVNLQPEEHVSNIKEYETTQQPEEWVVDSGASCHMTSNRDLLKEEREVHKTIKLADDSEIISNAEGAIEIEGQNKLIRLNDLYVEKLSAPEEIPSQALKATLHTWNDWHKRLGHLNEEYMKQMLKNNSAHNFNTQSQNMDTCQVCIQAKHPRTPFKPVLYPQSTRPLDLIHIDLIGPIQEESIGGAKYVLTLVDDFSRKIFVEFLSSKLETFDIIRSFIEEIEKENEIKVKQLRSDNGKEFTNHQMTQYLKGKGIKHQLTNVYTPQQNGISERYNRTLIEGTRALLIDSQLPLRYWAETMSTFAYLKNRTPCKKLGWITPEERFSNRKPTVAHLKIFGCIAYYYVHKHKRGKFQPTAKAGIFVGYSSTRKAWRLIDPENENVIETRDVKFLENKLGKEILNKNDSDDTQKYFLYNFPEETIPETSEEVENHDDHSHSDLENQDEHSELPYNLRPNLKDKLYYELSSDDEPIEDNEDKDPTYDPTVGALKLSHGNLLPSSYEEAINHPDSPLWQQAMDKEIHSLQNHHVWDLTELPEGAKAIKSKWIFSKKMDPQTNQEIYKARLVALGCSQEYGTDYTETFSPVMKTDSFRTLLAYATMAGYEFHHFDVETAFLYGKLSETIYMTQPPGYQDDKKKTSVCILNQALYGLKQSGRVWYETFTEYLFEIGLTQLKSDKCVFTFRNGNSHLLLGLHVDDMIIINSNPEILHDIIQKIRFHFKIKESLTTCNIFGIEIIKEDVRLILKQENYINKILQKYNMQDCKHISTPLDPNTNLDNFNSYKEVNKTQYQELIGSLLYLSTKSRPDIAFAVTLLSRYNQNPREMHMGAAKRILRYLKGTKQYGLIYTKGDVELKAYTDASWNCGRSNKARSTAGLTFYLDKNLISWSSLNVPVNKRNFCLSSDSRRVRVWRRRGERSNPAAIVERPTVRQRGIMVWGAIAYDSRSPLLRIHGTMTAQRYVDDVLRPVTLPYLQGVYNALYQQDNARPHTARISQQALQDVQMLPWPPYSPGLSPIEHVWDIIGRRLHALPQPRSEDDLWQMVEREWRAIPQDTIHTLIDSLPRRVAACIAVRGHRKRRQFKQTDAFTRGMVIGLKRAGWSIRQIAADTHLGASTVHRLWRRWLEQGNVAIYRNVGATRVTSARVDRRILRQAVAAPQATCTAILQHVQDTLDHSISTRTISRRLVANGLHSCRPLRRLPLTPPNRRQRLEWCRARSTWMTEWHRVVFSDESRFCLSSDSRRVRVWRRRGERSNPAAIVERPTVRQRGIMGVPNALYQQDNTRPHTARISQQALQDVQMLPWRPYSPDLSPIEHVWDIIGRRLHALPQPRSEDELWQMVEREWRAIPQDAIRTLIDSLPRRVAACITVR
ncbi:hypothetical protein LAZ67_X000187, partial [Cordylochernes scorpioides]